MVKFEIAKTYSSAKFVLNVGISLEDFLQIVAKVAAYIAAEQVENPLKRRGRKSRKNEDEEVCLPLEDKVLLTFYYLRYYPAFEVLGNIFGIHKSYACKVYHRILTILTRILKMVNPKDLMNPDKVKTILIDVTEQPIERPEHGQKEYYSGKRKRHTIKVQLIVCQVTQCILSVVCKTGHVHDFKILKTSKTAIHPKIKKVGDSGYQGIDKIYENCKIPFKKSKNKPLTPEQNTHNHQVAKERVFVENVIRKCKIFWIAKCVYRGKHKNYGKVWNVVAALVNLRYPATTDFI